MIIKKKWVAFSMVFFILTVLVLTLVGCREKIYSTNKLVSNDKINLNFKLENTHTSYDVALKIKIRPRGEFGSIEDVKVEVTSPSGKKYTRRISINTRDRDQDYYTINLDGITAEEGNFQLKNLEEDYRGFEITYAQINVYAADGGGVVNGQ